MPDPPSLNELRAARLAAAGKARCILCNRPPAAFGLWRPDPETQRLFGVSRLKRATITYALCSSCLALPDPSTRIEDAILADLARAQ